MPPPFIALPVIILRPEPGASATTRRISEAGLPVLHLPLFRVEPLAWVPPPVEDYDALLLTSAQALGHAGVGLRALSTLPALCVGQATAAAARDAGLAVLAHGDGGVAALLAELATGTLAPPRRLLWLAGEDRTPFDPPAGYSITALPVYRAVAVPVDPQVLARRAVVLLHSQRAARALAECAPDRALLDVVAISSAAADAAGPGWRSVHAATAPRDQEMVAIAAKLCHEGRETGAR